MRVAALLIVVASAGACGSAARATAPTFTAPASTAAASTAAPSTSTTIAGPTPARGPDGSCLLPTDPQLLERTVSPSDPPRAVLIGSANTVLCETTVDAFRSGVPDAPGWCTTLARYDDNPGYDVNAVPAPPLRQVIASAGQGCSG